MPSTLRSSPSRSGGTAAERPKSLLALFLVALSGGSLAPVSRAAELLEATIQLEINWRHLRSFQTNASHRVISVRCIFGPGDNWFIEGDFALNARITWWRFQDKIAERTVITKELPESALRDTVLAVRPPPVGQHTFQISDSPNGRPFGTGFQNIVWLALCSGAYLKQPEREIRMLIGRTLTPEYKDKTVVYDDSLGLPKTVEMYSSYGHLISKYEVLQSAKIGGWSIPLEFKLLQHDPPPSDAPLIESNPSTTEVLGHVTSIVKVLRIDLPAELGDQQAKEAK